MKQRHLLLFLRITSFGIICLSLLLPFPAESWALVIIANKSVPVDSMTKEDINKVFLGKTVKWDDGSQVIVATLKDSDLHKTFLKEYIQRSSSQFETWWRKQVFTGKGSFPKSFDKEEDILQYVSDTEGAIGYISSNVTTDHVKTLAITD